jgi:hypothetical protein
MPKFTIYATQTNHLAVVVDADSEMDALKLYDDELMTDDYEVENSDFKLEAIVEMEVAN